MSDRPRADIQVRVDATNPGQFFACCGLLELTDRLWPGAEGWFEGETFCLRGNPLPTDVNDIVKAIDDIPELATTITKSDALGGSKSKLLPVTLTLSNGSLKLDWWRDDLKPPSKTSHESCGKSAFKTWAGNQSPQQILYDRILPALRKVMQREEANHFLDRFPLTGRFGFDHSAAVDARDAGWSPDKLEMSVQTSPAIELFAAIGLQRFRPVDSVGRNRFEYFTWTSPMPPVVASACVCGATDDPGRNAFVFSLLQRGDYLYFSQASSVEIRHE